MLNVLAPEFKAAAPQDDARRNPFLVPLKEQTLPQPEPQTRPVAVRMVVLVGPPGSGKSFVAKLFRERGWEIVNQDTLGNRKKCEHAARLALNSGRRVLIDRTNIDVHQRSHWVKIARQCRVPTAATAAVFLDVDIRTCKERVMSRLGHPTLTPCAKSLKIVDNFFEGLSMPKEIEGFGHVVVLQKEALLKLNINNMGALEGVSGPANTPQGAGSWLGPQCAGGDPRRDLCEEVRARGAVD